MKHLLIFALISLSVLQAKEPATVSYKVPPPIPVTFTLRLPNNDATVVSDEKTERSETIKVRTDDSGEKGLQLELKDRQGKTLWLHDFGYNGSANSGCSVGIQWHKSLPLVLAHYNGYKWDHSHKLLFITKKADSYSVREFKDDDATILKFLRKQKGYDAEYEYWIYPSGFDGNDLLLECIPLEKDPSAHPLAQGIPWFEIKASIDANFKITPTSAKATHN